MSGPPRYRWWVGGVFAAGLAVWTWKLLEPRPVPESVLDELQSWGEFVPYLCAKTLHAGVYATLAVLGLVAVPSRWRPVVVAVMAAHGVVTEVLQYVMPFNRTGKVTDVLIDWGGIAAGVLAYRVAVAWSRPRRQPLPD